MSPAPDRRGFTFERLLAPMPGESFIKECFERRPFVQRGEADRFHDLFRLDEVDACIAAAPEPTGKGRAAAFGIRTGEGGREHYTFDDQGPDGRSVIAASRAYAEGYTIVANTLRYHHAGAADLCRSMEQALQHPVGANLYLTPPSQQGFWVHADAHDTFLVQIEGAKEWSIWFPEHELPLGECTERGPKPTGPPDLVVEVTAGDLLYMPHGVWHSGTTGDALSLHLTFGAIVMTWADLLAAAVRDVARCDLRMRRCVPITGAQTDFGLMAGEVWEMAQELLGEVTTVASQGGFGETLVRSELARRLGVEHPGFEPRLATGIGRHRIGLDDIVETRFGLRPVVTSDDDGARLVFAGGYVCGPHDAREAFEFVAAAERFSAGDLPGLPGDYQLALAHELVLQGAVRPVQVTPVVT